MQIENSAMAVTVLILVYKGNDDALFFAVVIFTFSMVRAQFDRHKSL